MIITVPTIIENKTRRPRLPDGTSFSLVEDCGDTMIVEIERDPEQQIAELQSVIDQLLIDALEVNNA